MSEPTRETTCQHVFGKSTETSWRWCGLCGLPEAVLLLATAEAEAARWKANDAASTEVIATTTIAWNAAEARATAAEQVRDLRITDHALLVDSYRELETDLLIVREKLAAAEQREAEKDARIAHLETELDHAVRFGDGATFSEPIALASPSTPSPTSALAEHCAECGEPVPQPPGYWVICQTCAATAKALLAKAKEPQP